MDESSAPVPPHALLEHAPHAATPSSAGPSTPYLHPCSPGHTNGSPATTAHLSAAYGKLGMRLLPVFFMLNILNFLDRANLAFASINMSQDLNLDSQQYGFGSGLFFAGYTLFQIPSQLIVRAVGAPVWLSVIVTVWGVTAASMAAITNYQSFYAVRTLLGIAEAGSFPGYWYYLTQFYPDSRITVPFAVTDSAVMVAQVLGPPLAAGLLHMDGTAGLRGWQWLFIMEGVPTLFLGLAMPFLLPARPSSTPFLQPSEGYAVQREVDACRLRHAAEEPPMGKLLLQTLTNHSMYLIGAVKFSKDLTAYGCMFWAPLLIRNMLHRHSTDEDRDTDSCGAFDSPEGGKVETGYLEVLLTGIPYSLAALVSILTSWHSQRTRERKLHISTGYVAAGIVLMALPTAAAHSVMAGFSALCGVLVLSLAPNGCLLALASAKAQGPGLPLNLAMFNSIGNIAGLFGPWLIGAVVKETCTFDLALYIMGVVLIAGGALAYFIPDVCEKQKPPDSNGIMSKRGSDLELASTYASSQQDNLYDAWSMDEA